MQRRGDSHRGQDRVESVRLKNVKTGKEESYPCDGVFIFVGMVPGTGFLKGFVDLTEDGFIKCDFAYLRTNVPGVFVAGDCRVAAAMQLATAVGDGVNAAMVLKNYFRDSNWWNQPAVGGLEFCLKQLVDCGGEVFFAGQADPFFLNLSVFEKDDCRYRADAEFHSAISGLVGIELEDLRLACVVLREFLDNWSHHPAGAAPWRPEIHQNGHARCMNHFIEIRVGKLNYIASHFLIPFQFALD